MLYIVATPIGNLQDISQRALKTLGDVSYVCAESITDAMRLLNALKIEKKKIIKYNDRNKKVALNQIIEIAKENDVAYITSAGMPGISDPGSDLIAQAQKEGIPASIIPGPSALSSAIAMSGIRAREFTFISFPPKKDGQLKNVLTKYAQEKTVLVFFESTHRILKTLNVLNNNFPSVYICVAKEMTKIFEEYISGTSQEVLDQFAKDPKKTKGEFTVVIDFTQ